MKKRVITISREFGSGGREIGKQLAKELGYAFYDRTLIDLEIKQSNLSAESIREIEEKVNDALLFELAVSGTYSDGLFGSNLPVPFDSFFLMQEKIIQNLVEQKPCVIVGTAADYIVRKRKDYLSVFIHSDLESKIRRATIEYGFPLNDIEERLGKRDQKRADHYRKCTLQEWGIAQNYHLTFNSDAVGLDRAVIWLKELVEK